MNFSDEMRQAAERLRRLMNHSDERWVFLKGGHLPGSECIDLLHDGDKMIEMPARRIDTANTHGTGCTLSAALAALLPPLESLTDWNRDAIFAACKAKAEELGVKNGWLLYPLGIALSGKQRTPGGGTDLACMMGRETTLARVKAAIEKLNG